MSSNSGSSWLNAAFGYLPDSHSLDSFFDGGTPLGPSKLTLERIEEMSEDSFLDIASKAHPAKWEAEDLIKDNNFGCVCKGHTMKSWNEAVTCAYLFKFGLYDAASVVSTPVGTLGHERALDAVKTTKAKVLPMRSDGPFPIIHCSELHMSRDPGGVWFPREYTPLYGGVPMLSENGEQVVGGGVVESFGLGGKGAKLPKGEHAIKEDTTAEVEPVYFCPLSFMAGGCWAAPSSSVCSPTLGSSHCRLSCRLLSRTCATALDTILRIRQMCGAPCRFILGVSL